MVLGRGAGVRCALQQKKLALDAKEFGHVPARVVALRSCERVTNGDQTLSHLPSTSEALRERAEKSGVTQHVSGLPKLLQSGLEKRQSGGAFFASDQEHPLQTAA